METCSQFLLPQQLCNDHKVQDGNSLIGSRSHQERGHNVLYLSEGCLLSNPDPSGLSALPSGLPVPGCRVSSFLQLLIAESVSHLIQHCELPLRLCQDLGGCYELGKIRP